MTATKERTRTGRLATLLPPWSAVERGSKTVHAAEETVTHYDNLAGHGPFDHYYPEFTALCGQTGWGEADSGSRGADQPPNLAQVNCVRCMATKRWKEAQ